MLQGMASWIFPTRLHRFSYLIRNTLVVLIGLSFLEGGTGDGADPESLWIGVPIFLYWLVFVFVPRLRDAGLSYWWVLLALVPLIDVLASVLLLFKAPSELRLSFFEEEPSQDSAAR